MSPDEMRELEMIVDRLHVQDPLGESLENYLQSLRRALKDRPALTSELLDQLSKNPTEAGFQAFQTLRELLEGTAYRRTVKQAAYRFSQRGFTVEGERGSDEPVVLVQKELRKPEAHVLPVLGVSHFITARLPAQEHRPAAAVSAVLDNFLETLSVKVMEGGRGIYRDLIEDAEQEFSVEAFEIPVAHAARVFYEMLDWWKNPVDDEEIERASKLMQPYFEPERPPYVYELMPEVPNPDREVMAVDPEGFFQEINFFAFLLSKDSLAPYWAKMRDSDQSVLIVSPYAKEDRIQLVLQEAADGLLAGETAFRFQRLFEEEAMRLKLGRRDKMAWWAWSVAQYLHMNYKPSSNPVLLKLVAFSIYTHWSEEFEEPSPSEPSGEVAEPSNEPEGFQRTESGLYIPR